MNVGYEVVKIFIKQNITFFIILLISIIGAIIFGLKISKYYGTEQMNIVENFKNPICKECNINFNGNFCNNCGK